MQLSCPKCGTRDVRVSHRQGLKEWLRAILGIYHLRCRKCRTRWETSEWASSAWKYARCPRCYRQELSTWSEQYYHPPRWTRLLVRLGATPYRCTTCRCNFVSYRPCKERYSWRKNNSPQDAEQSGGSGPEEVGEKSDAVGQP